MNIGLIPAKYAALAPRRLAIIDPAINLRLNYAELDRNVRRLANGFVMQCRIERGDRIAVLAKNCAEYMAIYYACARAGFITQPLNWRLGAKELAKIIVDGEPAAFVSSSEFRDVRDELQSTVDVAHWLEFGDDSDGSYVALIDGASDEEPTGSMHVGDNDPVLILYTGGTTGESKGAR